MDLEVIAEGVENEKQVELLTNANCHKIQGFYYSKPIPVDEIEKHYLRKCTKGLEYNCLMDDENPYL